MSQSHTDNTRQRFEREAESFDSIYRLERSLFSRWFNRTFRKAIFDRYDISFAQAGDVTDRAILDVGCGSGVYAVDFARRGAGRVVGVDFSSNMLNLAEQEAAEYCVGDKCEFIQDDFMRFDTKERFDISIAMGVFDYLPEPVLFLGKMVSMTTDRVIVSFPGHSFMRKPLRALRYRLLGKGHVFFYHEDDVKRIAAEAGLRETHIVTLHSSGLGYILVGKC
jgi:ubiquinone/menaquinone biosynthesis C-methylase UbiE